MNFNMTIEVSDSEGFGAYVASDGTSRPALIICPEVFGVNAHMRSVADRFARAGYLAVVPDMLWRVEPGLQIPYDAAGLQRGSELLPKFDIGLGGEDIGLVIEAVRRRPDCNGKVGVIGFCIGGTLAYLAAARHGVQAAVGYYAKGVEQFLQEAEHVQCSTILHYAGADRFIPEEVVDRVREGLAGCPGVAIFTYPGVDHGFNSEDRRAYSPDAAALAMGRTLAVLDKALLDRG